MGCVETRNASEEAEILFAEEELNFFQQETLRVDAIIRKYSSNGKINQNQLSKISEVLELKLYNHPPHMKIEDMLRSLLSADGTYDMKDWLILGILLSKGKPDIKAGLLYQVFDEELSNKVSINKMYAEFIPKIINISYQKLPMLAASGHFNASNSFKIEKYVNDMSQAKNYCAKLISDKLAISGFQVTESTFINFFSHFNQGALTSSSGWRKYLFDTFVENPPKKVFLNPYKKLNK